jgi:hypothetical protein
MADHSNVTLIASKIGDEAVLASRRKTKNGDRVLTPDRHHEPI